MLVLVTKVKLLSKFANQVLYSKYQTRDKFNATWCLWGYQLFNYCAYLGDDRQYA